MNINKGRVSLLVAGVLLGILIFIGTSIILSFLILAGLYLFIITRQYEDKITLLKTVVVAMVLRMLFLGLAISIVYSMNFPSIRNYPLLTKIVGHTTQLFRDFDREIQNGEQIMRYLKGEFGNVPVKTISVQEHGFLHVGAWTQGILNFIFGKSIFNLLIFPLWDLWSLTILYYLAKSVFDRKVADFTVSLYAIMPSVIFVACSNIRFSMGMFFFILMAFSLVGFSKNNKLKYLFLTLTSMYLFTVFKEKTASPVFLIIPLILFLALNIKLRLKIISLTALFCLTVSLVYKSPTLQNKFSHPIKDMIAAQAGFISEARVNPASSAYKIYDEFVYAENPDNIPTLTLVKMLPRALIRGMKYFIFSPFPWEIKNVARLYAYPYFLFWYIIVGFAFLGVAKSLFSGHKEIAPLLLLYGYFIVILSLALGNQGIAARFRVLVEPFFYLFAGSVLFGIGSKITGRYNI